MPAQWHRWQVPNSGGAWQLGLFGDVEQPVLLWRSSAVHRRQLNRDGQAQAHETGEEPHGFRSRTVGGASSWKLGRYSQQIATKRQDVHIVPFLSRRIYGCSSAIELLFQHLTSAGDRPKQHFSQGRGGTELQSAHSSESSEVVSSGRLQNISWECFPGNGGEEAVGQGGQGIRILLSELLSFDVATQQSQAVHLAQDRHEAEEERRILRR
mmetsp:Transcript_37424/g.79379  ORF Transcript_37424/g.79379 Transcript_37424/m.79379 type:complete len:211 (+) Transcript_37424:1193-1825(+)